MGGRTESIALRASTDVAAVRGADLVLFCVKSTDTEAVAREMAPHLGREARRRSACRTASRTRRRSRATCAGTVVPAVVYVATADARARPRRAPRSRRSRHRRARRRRGAGPRRCARSCRRWSTCSPRPACRCAISPDVMAELWSKLMVNCAYNADLRHRAGARMRSSRRCPRCASCSALVVGEVVALAAAEGVGAAVRAVDRDDGADRRGDAGASCSSTAQDMARAQAQRDRSPQRLRRAARPRARRADAGQPGPATRWSGWSKRAMATRAAASGGAPATAPATPRPLPAEFAQALRELGLATAHRAADRRAADRRRLVGHLAHRHRRRARSAPSARWRKLRVAADWRAPIERNRYEARWMQVAAEAPRRAARRRCWASTRRSACS